MESPNPHNLPSVLQIICDFYHTQDDMDGEEVGKTLLRQLVERYDKHGHFVREFFDREHFTLHSGNNEIVYCPPNSLQVSSNIPSFKEIIEKLNLFYIVEFNLIHAYGAFVSRNSKSIQQLEPVVYFYFLVYAVVVNLCKYYDGLLVYLHSNYTGNSSQLRNFYVKLKNKKQKIPLLKIMKRSLDNSDLECYKSVFIFK